MKIFKNILPFIILFFLIFLPFSGVLLGSRFFPDTGMVYNDMTSFYFSLKDWYKNQITAGQFPFWTNLVGNGYPVFAEGEIGALYPLNLLLYFFLPTLLAFNLNIFFHFLLAAVFTYLFCRISLKLSFFASLIAGLTYSLSGFFFARISYVHMIFIAAYFPLNLLLTERIVSLGKYKFAFLLAIIFSLQILAGYTEIAFYCFVLTMFYFILLLLTQKSAKKEKTVFLFCLSFLLAFLITAVQILPNWEVVQNSHRSGGLTFEAATASEWPISALSLFINPRSMDKYSTSEFSVPTVYGYIGIIPLGLAFLAATRFLKKRNVFIIIVMAVFAFLWAQGRLSPIFAILWDVVPGVKFFRAPVKLLFALEFFLAVLGALGFEELKLKIKNQKFLAIVCSLIILLIYVDLIYFNRGVQSTVSASEWFKTPASVDFIRKNLDDKKFQIYSHGTNNMDFETTKNTVLQQEFQNILPPDLNMLFNLPANRETFALFLRRQQEINKENTTMDLERQAVSIPARMKQSLAIQGVKYLLADVPINDNDMRQVLEVPFSHEVDHMVPLKTGETARIKVSATHIYENSKVYPRINFVNKVSDLSGKSDEETLTAVLAPEFDPTREVILQEIANETLPDGGQNSNKLQILKYLENRTEIQVKTDTPGYLVLTRTYYPGWRVTVDGQPAKIYRANYDFQAVKVLRGEHLVNFVFEPTYWRWGLVISGVALLITLGVLGFTLKKNI